MNDVSMCNVLFAATIQNMNVDLLRKSIRFDLLSIEAGIEMNHTLEINDYDSLLWLEKDKFTHQEYDIRNCDYYEFTSITFRLVKASFEDRCLKNYSMDYNIAIEIWDSALLLNASSFIVDGIFYDVKHV